MRTFFCLKSAYLQFCWLAGHLKSTVISEELCKQLSNPAFSSFISHHGFSGSPHPTASGRICHFPDAQYIVSSHYVFTYTVLSGIFFPSSFWETPERVCIPNSSSASASFSSLRKKAKVSCWEAHFKCCSLWKHFLPSLEKGKKRNALVLDTNYLEVICIYHLI